MSKTKKAHKSSDSESNSSGECSASSSEDSAEEEQQREKQQKREKKNRKQKDKKKKKHKKSKSSKKKSKNKSESDSDEHSSDISNSSEKILSASEDEKVLATKKLKREDNLPPVRVKRERSRSRDKEKPSNKSKWESPPRRVRSRSRERYRNDRSRSRERHRNERSRSRHRDRSQEHYRDRGNKDYKLEIKRERENNRRDYKPREERRERSPRRDRDRTRERERERERDYVKREQRSPTNRSRGFGNHSKNKRNQDDEKAYEWGKHTSEDKKPVASESEKVEKDKPNFGLSGALTEDANKVNGVVVKYAEPPEARKPKRRWRLYPFKGETALPVLHIHRQSCFLVGRDRKVVDLAVDHPSCSKQHAALQYRLVPFEREDGTQGKRVRLYLIDLDSANGTFLNNKRIDARKYYELMEKDVIKFGFSTREYVLLHENSKEDQEDDDIVVKEEPIDN